MEDGFENIECAGKFFFKYQWIHESGIAYPNNLKLNGENWWRLNEEKKWKISSFFFFFLDFLIFLDFLNIGLEGPN